MENGWDFWVYPSSVDIKIPREVRVLTELDSDAIELLKEGHIFLFVVITGFSIVLPLLKIGVLNRLLGSKGNNTDNLDNYLHWMHLYGKWSMLDVFVVAVLVVSVKMGAIASVEMRYGLYAFAAAVILTMYVTARVVTLSDNLRNDVLKTDTR